MKIVVDTNVIISRIFIGGAFVHKRIKQFLVCIGELMELCRQRKYNMKILPYLNQY